MLFVINDNFNIFDIFAFFCIFYYLNGIFIYRILKIKIKKYLKIFKKNLLKFLYIKYILIYIKSIIKNKFFKKIRFTK
jgi:hypothetical protein